MGGENENGVLGKRKAPPDSESDDEDSWPGLEDNWFEIELQKLSSSSTTNTPVLLITTHGAVTEHKNVAPMKITKINAAPFGCLNAFGPTDAHKLANTISSLINDSSSDEDMTSAIQEQMCAITKDNCQLFKRIKNSDKFVPYLKNVEQHGDTYNIKQTWKKGDEYNDKILSTCNNEIVNRNKKIFTPYIHAITLFDNNIQPDILRAKLGPHRRNPEGGKELYLSEVLQFINEEYPKITSLIIIDLSCSVAIDDNQPQPKSFGGKKETKLKQI